MFVFCLDHVLWGLNSEQAVNFYPQPTFGIL